MPPGRRSDRIRRDLMSREASEELVETCQRRRIAFELQQRREITAHFLPIDEPPRLDGDAFDVEPVLRPIGKRLVEDERSGGRERETHARCDCFRLSRSYSLVLDCERALCH